MIYVIASVVSDNSDKYPVNLLTRVLPESGPSTAFLCSDCVFLAFGQHSSGLREAGHAVCGMGTEESWLKFEDVLT